MPTPSNEEKQVGKPKSQLVTAHLEDISWQAFEAYHQVIQDFIRGHAGVYALFKQSRLYYVGLASNLMGRVKQHLRDRHHGAWDRFSVYLTRDERHMRELESLLIRISQPAGNRQGGKLPASKNLKSELNRRIKETEADLRARLLGGHVHQQRRRRKAIRARGAEVLAGLQDRTRRLKATHGGWEYSATLLKNGHIRYDREVFASPSGAAKAALGRAANGWAFWQYRDPKKGWLPLSALRR